MTQQIIFDEASEVKSLFPAIASCAMVSLFSSLLVLSSVGLVFAEEDDQEDNGTVATEVRKDKASDAKQLLANSSQIRYAPNLNIAAYYLGNNDANFAGDYQVFVPLWQRPYQLVFGNFRFYDKTGTPQEMNGTIGYRAMLREDQLLGFYGGYDLLKTEDGNQFHQLTAGVEYWRNKFFVGGNIYVPIGDKKVVDEAVNTAWLATDSSDASYQNILLKRATKKY